jgi:hypothetical protein
VQVAQDSSLSQALAKIGKRQNELPRFRAQRDEALVLVDQFSGGAKCATAASVLTFDNKTCRGNRDLGLLKSLTATTGNDIDVLMCTHQ